MELRRADGEVGLKRARDDTGIEEGILEALLKGTTRQKVLKVEIRFEGTVSFRIVPSNELGLSTCIRMWITAQQEADDPSQSWHGV